MDPTLLYVVVMGAYILATSWVGKRIHDAGKPYGKGKLALHIILFLFITAGVISSILVPHGTGRSNATLVLYLTCIALLVILINGSRMIVIKSVEKREIIAHKILVFIIVASIIASVVI